MKNEVKKRTAAAGQFTRERDYWLKKLSGDWVKTTFPYDSKGMGKDEKNMEAMSFRITNPVYAGLLKISSKSDVRLHIILVAGWLMLLNRYTGSTDIVVGIPVYRQEVEGQLINTVLAVRNTITGEMTMKELLLQVGETVLEANQNQNYPIETLVYKLNLPDTGGDFPLFDISILLEELHDKDYLQDIRQNIIVSFHKSAAVLEGVLEYNSQVYREPFIKGLVNHFRQLLIDALPDVNIPIRQIEILTEQERKQLLEDFNDNTAAFPRDKTVLQLIEEQAQRTPDRIACVGTRFIASESRTISITYRLLNEKSNRLAGLLKEKGVASEAIVTVMMERSIEMVESILAVWKAGGAYLPMDPSYPQERIDYMLKDSGVGILVSGDCRVIDFCRGEPLCSPGLSLHPGNLAYIIYTSGSTGKPKGAMVEHTGMMNHMLAKIDSLQITGKSIVAQNASQTFDISVWQFFAALTRGGRTVIYPDPLILDPAAFITRLIKDRVTILEVVPSYLSVFLDVVTGGTLDVKKLPGLFLDYLLVTGEEIKPKLAARWFEIYPHIKMVNAYGPTEASDDITHYVMDGSPVVEPIPIGSPIRNLTVYIVDRYMTLCPVGVSGELCVSGVGVGRGYVNNPQLTAEKFFDLTAKTREDTRIRKERDMSHLSYRTGDLARWLPDGNIQFLGRIDHQVKINGFRIELGEIENRLLSYPEVKEAVVIDREDEQTGKYLCAYIVGAGIRGLRNYLKQLLPDYMMPAHFILMDKLPLTANGKIDRKALPSPGHIIDDIPYIPSETLNSLEKGYGTLGGQTPKRKIRRQPFDSTTDIREEYRKLDQYSKQVGKTYYPLSQAQKIFYYNDKIYPDKALGGIFYGIKYREILDFRLLNEAFNIVRNKNPALRLRIVELEIDSFIRAAQYEAPPHPFLIDFFDFSGEGRDFARWVREDIVRPFQLLDSDLFYFAYIKFNRHESGYYVKTHHITADGFTFQLLFKEIHRTYRQLQAGAPQAEEPNPSFFRYLLEERDYVTSPQLVKDREFWHKTMLPLPPEADISSRKGKMVSPFRLHSGARVMAIPSELRSRMLEFCKHRHTSLFSLILSAFSIYVSRLTRMEDFVISSVNHGRFSARYREIAGLLIDFFPVRINIDNTAGFETFVEKNTQDVRHIVKNHGRYPYGRLLAELQKITGIDTRYLNNINLVYHPDVEAEYAVDFIHPVYSPSPVTLHINMSNKNKEGILELGWEYQLERFNNRDIACIHRCLLTILADALENPLKPLSQINLLSGEDKRRVLYEFNHTTAEFPADKTLYQLFEEQVIRTPGNIAVRAAGNPQSLTYEELNRKSNQLARRLRNRGVTVNTIVAVLLKRSLEMIIGIMGIMKAGGAYMAVGLTYPEKRIDYMCSDSSVRCILTDNTRELPGKADLCIDVTEKSIFGGDSSGLPPVNVSQDPAAIFYTSGSTGFPKGVVDEHRGLVNRLWWLKQLHPMEESDVILQQTPVIFDVSVWELFSWSFQGASLYFMNPTKGDKPGDLVDAAIEGGVTHLHIPPVSMLAVLDYLETRGKLKQAAAWKLVIASGEALLPVHVNAFNKVLYHAYKTRLYNLYGPTEASIEVSSFDCASGQALEKVPIGKPIHNIELFIVDDNMRLVPPGVPGQLCISGVGLARGYLNRPELTKEKFLVLTAKTREEPRRIDMSSMSCLSYLTGDLARWLPDGNIEFLGRIDQQVQMGGIRIEVSEIESLLLKHEDIKEAAVVHWRDEENDRQFLYAFVEVVGDPLNSDFKEVLIKELPHFMIPSRFIRLDRIPLTPTNKVDRGALRDMIPYCREGVTNITRQVMKKVKKAVDYKYPHEYGIGTAAGPGREKEAFVLSEEERNRILYEFNDTGASYPEHKTLHRLFAEQVEKKPDHIAVLGTAFHLTYLELDKRAGSLARFLQGKGVKPNDIAGMMMERTADMIIGIIAVMKTGAAYLPIGPEFPPRRIRYMLEDCCARILITDNLGHKNKLPRQSRRISPDVIDIRGVPENIAGSPSLSVSTASTDPVHILYTSGTTGSPKGVIIEHKNVVRLLFNDNNLFDFDGSDVWTLFHAYFFDFSVWEMFGALLYGGKLVVIPQITAQNPARFLKIIKKEQVTVLNQTPSGFYPFASEELKYPTEELRLKYVIFGGEPLKPAMLKNWKARYPQTKLINMYGITETTVHVTFKEIEDKEIAANANNLGKAIPTLKTFILNDSMELVPPGVVGEIFVSGEGLARGYLNQPELTADKFLTAKTREDTQRGKEKKGTGKENLHKTFLRGGAGGRRQKMYKTGDLGRWLPNGDMEFLGRKDQQLKLRGLRIEPGEIENILLTYEGLDGAAVVLKKDENGEPYLGAAVVSPPGISKDQLRKHLAGELPHFMIPSEFFRLDKMPLTANGKINRKLLELIEIEDRKPGVEYVAPKTEIETKIAGIWKGVLNIDRVGIRDNFFDIGGNSLGIIQVNFKLKEVFKWDIPALIMFEYPTIASIVDYLEKNPGIGAGMELKQNSEEKQKDRTGVKDKGKNRMRQRKSKLKVARV